MPKIALVDDDRNILTSVSLTLEAEGYQVSNCTQARIVNLDPGSRAHLEEAGRFKIVVGHGGAFRHAARELGVLSEADVAALSMYHAQPVYLARREGRWQQVAGRWKVRTSNGE